MVPNMTSPPAACRFAARCPFVADICTKQSPPLAAVNPGHTSRCLRAPLERLVS
jgi:peptide/nickel transport system ATP-binding protein